MIGVSKKAERERIIDALYAHLRQHFEWTRQKEEKAILNRRRANRSRPRGPAPLAVEIVELLRQEHPEYARTYPDSFLDGETAFDTYELPSDSDPELLDDLIHQNEIRFRRGRRTMGTVQA